MSRLGRGVLLAVLAIMLPAGAMAADFNRQIMPPPTESSNWYLRLDFGFKIYRPPEATFDLPGFGYTVPGYGEFKNERISNTGLAGVGIGIDLPGALRADLTIDYEWAGQFEGYLYCAGCGNDPEDQYSYEYADISAWSLLLNGYLDFAKRGGPFVPYVGVGVGVAMLKTTNIGFQNPDHSIGTWTTMRTWNLAWAATAGVAMQLTPSWKADVNYRFVSLGTAMAMTILGGGTPIVYDNISAHELRFGLRYQAW